MPQHATRTSFQKGHQRSPESIAKQVAHIARLTALGLWTSQRPEVRLKLQIPCPGKARHGQKNGRWKPVGTKRLSSGGQYVQVKIAEPNVWEYEHRVVASTVAGRALSPREVVHHLNSNKLDNAPENLVIMTPNVHSGLPKTRNGHPLCPLCGYRHPPHATLT